MSLLKKFKPFWVLLFIILLVTTIVSADSVEPRHNSKFYLQYGSGNTICTDTSTAHSYWTTGNAHNTHSTRLAVYVLNGSGKIMDSDGSTSKSTYAAAWWTRSSKTAHRHRATSALVAY